MRLDNVCFAFSDARSSAFDVSSYTHIFMYDYIFDDSTHQTLFRRLAKEATSMCVLVTFCNYKTMIKYGWPMDDCPLKLLKQMQLGTTGKNRHKANIYLVLNNADDDFLEECGASE